MGEVEREQDASPPDGRGLVAALRIMLRQRIPDLDGVLDEFGQIAAAERRARGEPFGLREHVRGLVLALLSNQRPWLPIARRLPEIERVMLGFDPERLERARSEQLVTGLRALRAGNRALSKQMRDLGANVRTLRWIEAEHGSVDAFIDSAPAEVIARRLADPRSAEKLRQVGFALAMEYLRNVGVSTAKPDTHVLRILGPERLGCFERGASLEEVVRVLDRLALEGGVSTTELDNLVWMFGARGYGAICGAVPRCELCGLRARCRWAGALAEGAGAPFGDEDRRGRRSCGPLAGGPWPGTCRRTP